MKGLERGQAIVIMTSPGDEGGLCRTTDVMYRGRAHVDPRRQGKEKEKKGCLLLARAGLSTYY